MQAHLLALALGAAIGLSSGIPSAALAQAQNNAPAKGAQLTGAPIGDWRGGPVTDPDGKFAYCVAENRFDNKLALVIARNPNGETNLAIGIPGAGMAKGTKFPMSVRVDETVKRSFTGIAVEPDLLVVSTGKDDELYESMRKGSRLIMQGPTDTAIFQLRGTGKALGELKSCAQNGSGNIGAGGKPPAPNAQGGAQGGQKPVAAPPLPETLRAILNAAGLRQAVPLSLAGIPEDRRPADFAWKIGPVFGGVREARAPAEATFEALTTNYLDVLKQRCSGAFTATPAAHRNAAARDAPHRQRLLLSAGRQDQRLDPVLQEPGRYLHGLLPRSIRRRLGTGEPGPRRLGPGRPQTRRRTAPGTTPSRRPASPARPQPHRQHRQRRTERYHGTLINRCWATAQPTGDTCRLGRGPTTPTPPQNNPSSTLGWPFTRMAEIAGVPARLTATRISIRSPSVGRSNSRPMPSGTK